VVCVVLNSATAWGALGPTVYADMPGMKRQPGFPEPRVPGIAGYPRQRRRGVCGSLLAALLVQGAGAAFGQAIIADNYNVTGSGTGFALNAGVNSGINPPVTRLTGTAAPNLRYILTTMTKTNAAFGISSSKLRVTPAANPGRFSLSADGTTAFDFASALGAGTATPTNPVVYDLSIKMANNSAGTQRCSFALGSAEGDATTWDFGLQLYRASSSDNFYTIGKRVDTGSSGLGSDLNAAITSTAAGTYGSEITFLIRVTDAGAETAAFHSRVRVSMDAGSTWLYDSAADAALPNGWRLNGAGRYILWDVAPDAGNVTYDNFSVVPVPLEAALISPQGTTPNLGASPILTAAVSNRAPGSLTVTFYGREAATPFAGRDFAIVVLPDTQNYAREAAGNGDAVKEEWFAQTDWIVANRVSRNIAYVAHLGDVVQNGDVKDGSSNNTEWRNATNAMYRLENPVKTLLAEGIPYGVAVGNHDQEPIGDLDGTTTHYNQYFGISHFNGKSYYGGHYGDNNDSHFDLFSISGVDFIVLYFEYGRYGSGVLDWANAVLATNQTRHAIVVTHYAGSDSTPSNLSAQGQALYDGLKDNTNFFLMLGGHVFNNDGEGSRTNTYQGRMVRTYISDFQGYMNGGNGFMRIMYFSPSNSLVNIKTYSPWLDEYRTDTDSQMSFPYTMQKSSGSAGTPYAVLGTFAGVAPGSLVSCPFPALEPSTTYEWYVRVADAAGNSATSTTGKFMTGTNVAPVVTNRVIPVMGDQPTPLTLSATDGNGDYLTLWTKTPPLYGSTTAWDAQRGSLTYIPARGYHGVDRFTFQASDGMTNSQVATVALNVTAPPDTNGDGLPDAWEASYAITDPNADEDQDGQSNLAEYLANTNPTNAASALTLLSAGWVEDGYFELKWASVGGMRYRVQYSNGDAGGGLSGAFTDIVRDVASEMDDSPYGVASTQSFTDATTNTARYYRIKVVP
jgi:hypothetical protein